MGSKERYNIVVEQSNDKVSIEQVETEVFSSLEETISKKKIERAKEIVRGALFGAASTGGLSMGITTIVHGVRYDDHALIGFGTALVSSGILFFDPVSRHINKARLVTRQIEKVKSAVNRSHSKTLSS